MDEGPVLRRRRLGGELYRVIGGDECMAGQLRRVREVAGLSTVSVRIRPLTAGALDERASLALIDRLITG